MIYSYMINLNDLWMLDAKICQDSVWFRAMVERPGIRKVPEDSKESSEQQLATGNYEALYINRYYGTLW